MLVPQAQEITSIQGSRLAQCDLSSSQKPQAAATASRRLRQRRPSPGPGKGLPWDNAFFGRPSSLVWGPVDGPQKACNTDGRSLLPWPARPCQTLPDVSEAIVIRSSPAVWSHKLQYRSSLHSRGWACSGAARRLGRRRETL